MLHAITQDFLFADLKNKPVRSHDFVCFGLIKNVTDGSSFNEFIFIGIQSEKTEYLQLGRGLYVLIIQSDNLLRVV